MTPACEVLQILQPAYEPCAGFQQGSCSHMRWAPIEGHVPRGFCGAIGNVDEVRLILVCAEPGNPHANESHLGDNTPSGRLESVNRHAWLCFENRTDQFHKNVREIMELCWPSIPFETQMRRTWITDSVLCSALTEGGRLPVKVERECVGRYLIPQLHLFPNAVVASLGRKAKNRLEAAGITGFVTAGAAAPPGCYLSGVYDSWMRLADLIRSQFPA